MGCNVALLRSTGMLIAHPAAEPYPRVANPERRQRRSGTVVLPPLRLNQRGEAAALAWRQGALTKDGGGRKGKRSKRDRKDKKGVGKEEKKKLTDLDEIDLDDLTDL